MIPAARRPQLTAEERRAAGARAARRGDVEMTSEPDRVLILIDDEGGYYAVPEALIRRGRIPAERRPALERAPAGDDDDDVAGFLFCPHCGHAVRSPAPAARGIRYRPLAVTRLAAGFARMEMGGRL